MPTQSLIIRRHPVGVGQALGLALIQERIPQLALDPACAAGDGT
jgi:hypothetical protein